MIMATNNDLNLPRLICKQYSDAGSATTSSSPAIIALREPVCSIMLAISYGDPEKDDLDDNIPGIKRSDQRQHKRNGQHDAIRIRHYPSSRKPVHP